MANKNLARTHRARGWKQAVCVQGLEQTSPSRCSFMPPHCTLILGAQCGAHNSHLELAYTRTAMVYVEVVGLSLKVVQISTEAYKFQENSKNSLRSVSFSETDIGSTSDQGATSPKAGSR
ncbi:hypothetical protein PGT21_002075 [Puccinia graminis f. sp. tritici]|uniref:Uncharacterized protein n=1 Tax=Puccinia graminis f. sp. tritici TaxID=56615 RepID=A0A5B0LKJ7_PUCGR|nr:hypothetical protein PGT21_002075 [Puccinia graminis f. sp. tritici]